MPFPDSPNIGPGITPNGSSDTFTVTNAGTYYIAYDITLDAAVAVSSRLLVNRTPIAAATINSLLGLTNFQAQAIVNVGANQTVQIEFFGAVTIANLLASQPSSLTIIRLA
uniref:BclA C-terminal domain-containing protein n=1 Tax=Brevibacillus daliensis TaxID=2892995 RepID=UPI001E355280|nr:hypothetical protein [Brevibacillus daliensis]